MSKPSYILGISAYYHDSAACLLRNGEIFFASQEERYTRKKHDASLPVNAVLAALKFAQISIDDISLVAFYEKPFLKFERILESHLVHSPSSFPSFYKAMSSWIKDKLWMKNNIAKGLDYSGKILFFEHHLSHAASSFFPSLYKKAAFLTTDGVGEFTTTSFGTGIENKVKINSELSFPHSLGMLYSAFTYYTGFRVNSGEYKVMGLAPYGTPKYAQVILDNLIDLKQDGSFRLNMEYFSFMTGLTMTNEKFAKLFGGPPRKSESKLTQKVMDLAASVQHVAEEVVLRMGRHVYKVTKQKKLCMAGGVALNCVANGRLLREGPFSDIWIQPAAGDAGGALGAATLAWHHYLNKPRTPFFKKNKKADRQQGSYLGEESSDKDIKLYLENKDLPYTLLNKETLNKKVAKLIASKKVVGWFQGRMEYGPRALGNRSILGDARSEKMQKVINLKIKFREGFRPFAPSVLEERISDYFDIDRPSPYMLLVTQVAKKYLKKPSSKQKKSKGLSKLHFKRSSIPAVTHVNYSARIQSVNKHTNPKYHALVSEFENITGCPVIVNTSFNVRGEPIVRTVDDAYRCFMRTDMDYLVLGSYLLKKKSQPKFRDKNNWKETFVLD